MAINETEHLLACLAEECAEVSQRVTKALRFGVSEVQPGQALTNAERIANELTDLFGVVEMLAERGVLRVISGDAVLAKKRKVEHFIEYARQIGALTLGG